MIPKTPEEFFAILYKTLVSRIYLDLTTEARRRRLTEHDIATIERRVLDFRRETDAFAHEFETFETEPVVARTFQEMQEFFAVTKAARIEKVQQK
jgi:hypothetical protein